jgi:hypothetical protein
MPLYEIKICPITFEASEAIRILKEKGVALAKHILDLRSSSDLIGARAIIID